MSRIVQETRRYRIKAKMARHSSSAGGSNTPPSREACHPAPVCIVSNSHDTEGDLGSEVHVESLSKNPLHIRNEGVDGAFKPERVDEVLRQIKIGPDLMATQRSEVENLLRSYADCFALSVSEVRRVDVAVHRLNIPQDASFSKRVHQWPLTPPQRQYLHEKIDEMQAAGIIQQCNPSDVKCVSPITLAQKAHEGKGLSLDELQHKVNDECLAAGLPPAFNLPP